LKFLKAIMIVAVLASALSLGACAQKKEEVVPAPGKTTAPK
jgi:PBP1b-binding outer membrane lipoprotein LpoB